MALETKKNPIIPVQLKSESDHSNQQITFKATNQTMENQLIPVDQIVIEKNHKEQVIQQLVLEKAIAQQKFDIAANVLHDIGNAVVGFGSYLTRIKRSLAENLTGFFETRQAELGTAIGEDKATAVVSLLNSISAAQKTNQEEIEKSISEQLRIITHIQEILNIQRQYVNGHDVLEKKPTNLRTIINDCMAMLFASMEKRGILLSFNIPAELPLIQCDHTRLMQVILNILKNSIEAIDMNGNKKVISLNVFTRDEMLILQVHDSGNGFDEATGSKLFERGFTTKSTGTGLGLNNCRLIIESYNGTIDITSEGTGKGALTTIGFKI